MFPHITFMVMFVHAILLAITLSVTMATVRDGTI